MFWVLPPSNTLRETTGRQRRRLFVYHAYLAILNEGTEPLR
jgi:hypothetical protein